MKKCIVTGATGFIGAALCRELLRESDEVFAVVRPKSARMHKLTDLQADDSAAKTRLHVVEADLGRLGEALSEALIRADVFFHLAWNGSSGAEREDFDIQQKNIAYTTEAIRAAKACGCTKFVGAGSQAEYGVVHGVASEDKTVPHPFMMYGAAKLAAYQMGRLLAAQCGIGFVWPRIYSVYGVGENSGTLISYLIETLKKGETPQLSPCKNMWNFLYIDDCVKILAALGKSGETEGIYNVASGDTRLLKEFVAELRDIVAPGVKLDFGARIADEKRTFWLEPDTGKLKSVVKMEYVSFAEGVALQSQPQRR